MAETENQNLATEKVECSRKTFFLDLEENHRGVMLRVTERGFPEGPKNRIMIPVENLGEFVDKLTNLCSYAEVLRSK